MAIVWCAPGERSACQLVRLAELPAACRFAIFVSRLAQLITRVFLRSLAPPAPTEAPRSDDFQRARSRDVMVTAAESAAALRATPVPNSAWRLIVLEFWERFSYYGILAILVLFLTSPASAGGFGWSDSRALDLLATFTALAFMLPTLGGYIADRWIGARTSVLVGSWLLVFGNVSITFAALHSKLPALAASRAAGEGALFIGMMLVALGNGFFKSSLITLLGGLFPDDGLARDRAFRHYYQAIMLGALASSLCVGAMAQAYSWWTGFALTAFGMAISLLILLRLPSRGLRAPTTPHSPPAAAQGEARLGAAAISIGVFCAFLPLIAIAWVQLQGLWLLEVERWCDRTIGSFTVPSSWLLAVNAIVIVMLARSGLRRTVRHRVRHHGRGSLPHGSRLQRREARRRLAALAAGLRRHHYHRRSDLLAIEL